MSKIQIKVVEEGPALWAIEEPPEPVITVTYDGGSWVVYGDENASHPDYEERWWPAVLYGGGRYKDEAMEYARKWAKAVRGVYEQI